MSKVDDVALAILAKVPSGYGMTSGEAEAYARAAIEAMRIPTEAMENAGDNHAMSCAKVWIEMIDAALKEQTK